MRKVIVCNIMSLDGYFEGPGGNVMVLPMGDAAFDPYNLERHRAASTLLLGASTYRGFSQFWPGVKDDPNASNTNHEISHRNDAIDKVVVSDTLTPEQTGVWKDTTRIIRRAEAYSEIARLKEQVGGEILIFGSHILWNDLLTHGLVDELHLMIGNVVLGNGTPIFNGPVQNALRLANVRKWDNADNVVHIYEVISQK